MLIVDDHPILRQGIALLVNREPDLEVCGQAEQPDAALALAREHRPEIAVVDISLRGADGIDLIREMLAILPEMKVLVLSMHTEAFYAERAFRAGARGYVTKGEPSTKVVEGIRRMSDGEIYVSERIAAKIVGKLAGGRRAMYESPADLLSGRERQVFQLIGRGMSTRQIADQLAVSSKTVETYRAHIKEKLQLGSGSELLQTAIRWRQSAGST